MPLLLILGGVEASRAAQPVEFDNQIIPLLTKAGCNTGACHGAAVGRGGLKLSLYGGDPVADFDALVIELEGRRVNLASPDESLILLKPTETLAHGGGERFSDDSESAQLLLRWIREGAERVHGEELKSFSITPQIHVAETVGSTLQLSAKARLGDGTEVDVTAWTVFTPEDPAAVSIDKETAEVRLLHRGRHIVVARFLAHVRPIELLVPLTDQAISVEELPADNFIDQHIGELLSTLRIPLSPPANDALWLRRASLDLTGRLPSLEALAEFSSSPQMDKRQERLQQLLGSEEFNIYWTAQLAELLRISPKSQDAQGALVYQQWLKWAITEQLPYDQIARSLLTSTGDAHLLGPANFHRTAGGPREQAEFWSELFMGSRLRCANCHNHPLDRWTQDDYHGLAAILAKVESGRFVKLINTAEVTHPRTGEAAQARIPGERWLQNEDELQSLADWLTDAENPYFAKAIVNRLWKALMGRGLVEPTDDFRATNPATHPQLLNELAADFVKHNYDLRHTLRTIASSAAYARSSLTLPENQADDRFYSHALYRPLQALVLADALSDVTGVAEQFGDEPLGTRAIELVDPAINSLTLDILGRCSRQESCEDARATSGGLTRMLHLFNGPLLNRRVDATSGRMAQLLAGEWLQDESLRPESAKHEIIVDEFYRRALSRKPSAVEQTYWRQQFEGLDDEQTQQALEDFLWSILSCREFVTNH